jgi:serine/threonine protein kinase/CHASE2 domain-containing sensor protein
VPISLKPGDLVERYRVEAVLGEGGTARVYRVRHTTLATVHALKVLTLDHEGIRQRLIAEGKAQARMSHVNLVPVRDVLSVDGAPALLMDFVPGRSLQTCLRQAPLSVAAALRLFRGIVEGVGYAHARGLVHRDIKPANILLDESVDPPVARVADFGLVRVVNLAEDAASTTRAGMAMGTPGFMAPEQLRDARSVDERADIFALGAVLYCMLTGRAPFEGRDMLRLMNDAANGNYPRLNTLLTTPHLALLETLVDGCLRPTPSARFQSTDALLQRLGTQGLDAEVDSALPATRTWNISAPAASPVADGEGPGTIERLDLEAPDPGVSSASVIGLVVDQTGQGHAAEVRVRLDPNSQGVRQPPNVSRDATVAAQLAAAVVLGDAVQDWGVTWHLAGNTAALQGTSLGLPLAVAIHCARHEYTVPDGWAFTGGLDLDGRIAPVSGVPAKLRAAHAAGVRTVAVPADGLGALEVPPGLEVVASRTLSGLLQRISPEVEAPRRSWWRPRLFALFIPMLVAFTGLSQRFEPLVQDVAMRAIHGRLPSDNTAIIAFAPQADARKLREKHPAVVHRLVELGVRSIFFDITMTAKTEADAAFAESIVWARERGVSVILPVVLEGGLALEPGSETLQEAAVFGAVLAHVDTALWHVRRAPVRVRTLSSGDYWHAAVQSVRGHLAVKEEARVEKGFLVIGPNRNPVWADLVQLHPTEASPIFRYDALDSWEDLAGRTVIIGEMGGSDDLHRTDADTVYGVEIEAALIETLLQQRAPRVAAPELDTLFALAVGLLTALVGFAVPRNRVWIAGIVPVCGVVFAIVLVVAGVLVALFPMMLAAVVGFWAGRSPLSGPVVTKKSRTP